MTANGVYKFDPSVIRVGLIAGVVGLLFFGSLGVAAEREENFAPGLWLVGLVLSLACIPYLAHVMRLSGRTLQVSDSGISVHDNRGNEIGSLKWVELAKVTERRKMAQLALWDKSGARRVLVDQQFENFSAIRSRILAEYAKAFTLKPLPIEFRHPRPLLYESFVYATGAAFLAWGSWSTFRQNQRGLSVVFLCFMIAAVLSLLNLYPQMRGPSVLFEDRFVLRSLFRTEVLYKKSVTSVEIRDVANPRSGTKFSLVTVQGIGGKRLKITSKYGSVPEIYLTLRAWLAQQ